MKRSDFLNAQKALILMNGEEGVAVAKIYRKVAVRPPIFTILMNKSIL